MADGARAMRSAATFLKVSGTATELTIKDITQSAGGPGDLELCTYDDNVTRQHIYWYFSSESTGGELPEGWYEVVNGEPDFDKGIQDAALPYGQGCVINSCNSDAAYTSAGAVDSVEREFSVADGARKMMGNVLPKQIMLSDLTQSVGGPGDLEYCKYDDNVTRQNVYWFFSSESTGGELPEGWYEVVNGEPDFDKGIQDFEIASGEGFVINSCNNDAVLKFPSAY